MVTRTVARAGFANQGIVAKTAAARTPLESMAPSTHRWRDAPPRQSLRRYYAVVRSRLRRSPQIYLSSLPGRGPGVRVPGKQALIKPQARAADPHGRAASCNAALLQVVLHLVDPGLDA